MKQCRNTKGMECYFVPITNCTKDNIKNVFDPGRNHQRDLVPSIFKGNDLDWWRAQATRYMIGNPQPWLKEYIRKQRIILFGKDEIPDNVINVHVRHGDKWKEMKLLPFSDYMDRANIIRKVHPEVDKIFLSTEDPQVIEETKNYPTWKFYYTNETRTNTVAPPRASFTNLFIGADCDYFIGTLASNWDRMIDEFRKTSIDPERKYIPLNNGQWIINRVQKSIYIIFNLVLIVVIVKILMNVPLIYIYYLIFENNIKRNYFYKYTWL